MINITGPTHKKKQRTKTKNGGAGKEAVVPVVGEGQAVPASYQTPVVIFI
jgi:hypothetical protein